MVEIILECEDCTDKCPYFKPNIWSVKDNKTTYGTCEKMGHKGGVKDLMIFCPFIEKENIDNPILCKDSCNYNFMRENGQRYCVRYSTYLNNEKGHCPPVPIKKEDNLDKYIVKSINGKPYYKTENEVEWKLLGDPYAKITLEDDDCLCDKCCEHIIYKFDGKMYCTKSGLQLNTNSIGYCPLKYSEKHSKKNGKFRNGWDSEPNTDYVTRVNEGVDKKKQEVEELEEQGSELNQSEKSVNKCTCDCSYYVDFFGDFFYCAKSNALMSKGTSCPCGEGNPSGNVLSSSFTKSERYCQKCGAKNSVSHKYCHNCGEKLRQPQGYEYMDKQLKGRNETTMTLTTTKNDEIICEKCKRWDRWHDKCELKHEPIEKYITNPVHVISECDDYDEYTIKDTIMGIVSVISFIGFAIFMCLGVKL